MNEPFCLRQSIAKALKKSNVKELASFASNGEIDLNELLDLCFDPDAPVAFRASWILEHVAASSPMRFMSVFPDFISRLVHQSNRSCQRHFTKILMLCTDPAIGNPYGGTLAQVKIKSTEEIVEVVFTWFIDPETPVAVRVNCMDILFNMRHACDWIKEELSSQINFYRLNGSAAIQSRGKKIIKKMEAD